MGSRGSQPWLCRVLTCTKCFTLVLLLSNSSSSSMVRLDLQVSLLRLGTQLEIVPTLSKTRMATFSPQLPGAMLSRITHPSLLISAEKTASEESLTNLSSTSRQIALFSSGQE